MPTNKKQAEKMVLKTGYQIDSEFNFFEYFDHYMSLKIKGNMKVILLYLVKCHGKNGIINPSQKDMAKKCGMNLTQLKDNLKKLEALGLIKRCRTGRSCYYFVAKPDSPENGLSDSPEIGLSDSPENGPSLIRKNKTKDKSKDKMLPQGIFFKKYGSDIPKGIIGNFRVSELNKYTEKYGDEFLKIVRLSNKKPSAQRARYVRGAITNLEKKEAMKYENQAIIENEQYKQDLAIAAARLTELTAQIGQGMQ